MYRLIVLTRGTGQGTSRSASTPHRGLPPAHQGCSGQQTVVVSGATASQAPRAGSSTSPQRIAASRHHVRRVPIRLHFWRKNCLSPPDVIPTSCSLSTPKGALQAYQDVVDALLNPLEHQGRRNPFSRYLHLFWRKYTRYFSIFHKQDAEFFSCFMEKNPV